MKCPACATREYLRLETTTQELRVRRCPSCDGCWIRSDDYWRWRSGRHADAPPPGMELPTTGAPSEPGLRFCPEDGYVLARYEVGSPHAFLIDQCRTCSGVWCDAGELEALSEGGLTEHLHTILSEEWQDEMEASRRAAVEEEQWLRQLGAADLARISEIKEWLDGHPKRSELYAFLRFHERAV